MLFSCNNEENSMTSFSKGNNDADVYPPQYFEDHNDYIGCNVYPNRASDGQLVALEHPVHANDFFFWVD